MNLLIVYKGHADLCRIRKIFHPKHCVAATPHKHPHAGRDLYLFLCVVDNNSNFFHTLYHTFPPSIYGCFIPALLPLFWFHISAVSLHLRKQGSTPELCFCIRLDNILHQTVADHILLIKTDLRDVINPFENMHDLF